MAGPNLWYVGVALEIVSTMTGTVGKQLIRFSETQKKRIPRRAALAFTVGLVVNTLLGPIIDMTAYSFAAQSLIAPFGGLDVVWNALLAPYLLNEKLTRQRLLGCALIVLGTATAGCFGNHKDPEYTLEYLEETLVNMRVLLYVIAFAVWFLLNRLVLMRRPQGSLLRGLSLGLTAGTIAGNMFCIKAAIELIQRSILEQEGRIWLHWLPYALLAGGGLFAVTNVVFLTKGLQEYEALFMVTIYEGAMIVSGCVSGAVVLLDLRHLEAWRVALYWISVLIVVLGMCVMFGCERVGRSSLAAGEASLAELPACCPRSSEGSREASEGDLVEELRERSHYAICPPPPTESCCAGASAPARLEVVILCPEDSVAACAGPQAVAQRCLLSSARQQGKDHSGGAGFLHPGAVLQVPGEADDAPMGLSGVQDAKTPRTEGRRPVSMAARCCMYPGVRPA